MGVVGVYLLFFVVVFVDWYDLFVCIGVCVCMVDVDDFVVDCVDVVDQMGLIIVIFVLCFDQFCQYVFVGGYGGIGFQCCIQDVWYWVVVLLFQGFYEDVVICIGWQQLYYGDGWQFFGIVIMVVVMFQQVFGFKFFQYVFQFDLFGVFDVEGFGDVVFCGCIGMG